MQTRLVDSLPHRLATVEHSLARFADKRSSRDEQTDGRAQHVPHTCTFNLVCPMAPHPLATPRSPFISARELTVGGDMSATNAT